MRYGIVTPDGKKYWFFNLHHARRYACLLIYRGVHGWIVSGELVNDEGCTPYIAKRESLEAF